MERTLERRTVYQGRILDLRVDRVAVDQRPGKTATREVVCHRPAVAIIALDGEDVLLVRQYRYAIGRVIAEVPAGLIDPGEEPEVTAHRELREETGFDAGQMKYLGSFFTSPGFCDEKIYLFLAQDLRPAPLAPDDDEFIDVIRLPLDDLQSFLSSEDDMDLKTLAALSWLALHRSTSRQ